MDDLSSVVLQPTPVVFSSLEAFVGHVDSREGRTHADEPGVGVSPQREKVSARGWSAVEAEPKQKPVITPEGSMAARTEKP